MTADVIPTLELRADEPEAVAIARKGAFFYRARHGAEGEERARQLDEFADAAFSWQHESPEHSAALAPSTGSEILATARAAGVPSIEEEPEPEVIERDPAAFDDELEEVGES